jgi:hypothetical protein
VIWNGGESHYVVPERRVHYTVPTAKAQEFLKQRVEGFWGKLQMAMTWPFLGPDMVMPLMVNVNAEEIRKTYDVSFDMRDADILVTAIPAKDAKIALYYSKIQVLLEVKNFYCFAFYLDPK